MNEIEEAKAAVLEAAREMDRSGLTEGTAGNVSARASSDRIVLTPTALEYDRMTVDDLVVVDLDGRVIEGKNEPTSEWRLHVACLRRHADISAVVHTHAIHASMFAATHQSIPSVIEEVDLYLGGDVRVTPYHPTGSEELGEAVADLLGDRAAALVANHGLVVVAATTDEALGLTRLVERTAQIIWGARGIGDPKLLPESAREKFSALYRERRAANSQPS